MAAEPDLSEFEALSQPRRMECGVLAALKQLATAERRKLDAALEANGITHAAVEAWLAKREVKVSAGTIARHRRGQCACNG